MLKKNNKTYKLCKQPRIELFKIISKSVLSNITNSLENDDHEAVEFNGEVLSFTGQFFLNMRVINELGGVQT